MPARVAFTFLLHFCTLAQSVPTPAEDLVLGKRARAFIFVLHFYTSHWHFGAARAAIGMKVARNRSRNASGPRPIIGRAETRL